MTRSVILLAAGGKIPPGPAAQHALDTMFNSTSPLVDLEAMRYMVANPLDIPRIVETIKPCRAPQASAIEETAAKATPISAWWAPSGTTKYLILQGAEDQIAPPENGALLQKDLGERATLVNVPNAGHLLPLEKTQATADHIASFIRQLDAK